MKTDKQLIAGSRVTPAPFLPEVGFVRERPMLAHVGAGRSTVRRWIKQGTFPKPVRLGTRMVAWRAEQIRAWIAARGAEQKKTASAGR